MRFACAATLVLGLAACGQSRADSELRADPPTPAQSSPEGASTDGVAAPTGGSESDEPPRAPVASNGQETGTTTEVLDGTDVVELSSLGTGSDEGSPAGRYSAEQGGSMARAVLRQRGEEWILELTDREPGAPPSRRRYTLRAAAEHYVGDEGVHLRRTDVGIVVLEPGADFWVHYWR